MTGLHEALDDIAAEITPLDPPVELAMRLGRRKRHGRRIAAIAGTAGAMALSAVAVVGIPALTGPASTPVTASGAGIPLARPVLLESPQGSAKEYGDAHQVNTATLRLFHRLACTPVPSALSGAVTNDAWKATVGYTAAQWNAPGSEVVSCDASGGKYVLGKAVILGSQVTSATAQHLQSTGQWVVDVTLNSAATAAFAQLTTSQATLYRPASSQNWNDAVLASTAIVINGDVQSAPATEAPITNGKLMIAGPQPTGFTDAEAEALATQLSATKES
jgi:preprotein translocase subunit SecD